MDISKIYIAIEERSSLTGLTSLPVLMGKDGELEAVWFNFYFENRGEEGTVSVESVFTTKDGETVTEEESSLEKVVVPMRKNPLERNRIITRSFRSWQTSTRPKPAPMTNGWRVKSGIT